MPKYFKVISISAVMSVAASICVAMDGSRDVFVTVPTGEANGWKTFEIISGGDDLGTVNVVAGNEPEWDRKWDGLGTYLHDAGTLRVFVNHEAGSDSSFTRIDLDVAALKDWIVAGVPNNTNSSQVLPVAPVVETVSLGWLGVGSGMDPLNNPCSGNVWMGDTFGAGRGFADSVYLLGEETFSDAGHIWVMDLATRLIYEAVDLGGGSWENATPIDTRRDDTIALILSEDNGASETGTTPLVLYVGQKDPESSDFLARNGLVGGSLYYWHAETGDTNGTISGIFSGGNGSVVAGNWQTRRGDAVLFSKSEDVHTNMDKDNEGYGLQVALASQGEAVFLVDCSALEFVAGDLSATGRTTGIQVLYQSSTQASANEFEAMDNLVWSPDGKIYVNEDDGEGDIWAIDVGTLLASYTGGDSSPDVSEVYEILDADFASESSGIIDISDSLDYAPGSIFLTTGLSNELSLNQIALCVAPTAQLKADVYTDWALGYPMLDTAAKRLATADPDNDGWDNATEFALGLSPDTSDTQAPLTVETLSDSSSVSFTAARSLDLVDYFVDYTDDLAAGFTDTVNIRAADVGSMREVVLVLPQADQLFARIRATLP